MKHPLHGVDGRRELACYSGCDNPAAAENDIWDARLEGESQKSRAAAHLGRGEDEAALRGSALPVARASIGPEAAENGRSLIVLHARRFAA
jgi:hypothetical protein